MSYPLNKVSKQILEDRLNDELVAFYTYWYLSMCCQLSGYYKASDYFEKESHDEKCHAKMITEYMLGRGEETELPKLDQPEVNFTDLKDAINLALKMEIDLAKRYEKSIKESLESGDIMTFNFLMRYLDIQKESIKELSEKQTIFAKLDEEEDQREAEQFAFEDKPTVDVKS